MENVLSMVGQMVHLLRERIYTQFGEIEKYTGFVLLLVCVVWFIGGRANRALATAQSKSVFSALSGQFAKVAEISRESNSHFFIYSTGRVNCTGMMVSWHLAPRHDALARLCFGWIWPDYFYTADKTVVEVFGCENLDLAITGFVCRKFEVKKLSEKFHLKFCKQNNGGLENTCWGPQYNSSSLTGYTLLADLGGKAVFPQVFSKTQPSKTLLDKIHHVYISGETKSIQIEFSGLVSPEMWEQVLQLTLTNLLDSLSLIKVTESVRSEVYAQRTADEQKRKLAAEAEAREIALAKKNAEKKQQQEQALKRMTPEAIRKMEEREKKRDLKKNSGKAIMMR